MALFNINSTGNGTVKNPKISGKNTGSCFAPDAYWIKNPVSPNWIFYRGKCTGVCQYLHRDLQRIICTGLILVIQPLEVLLRASTMN